MNKKILLAFFLLVLPFVVSAKDSGKLDFTLAAPTTQVMAAQCGQILPALNSTIYADNVAGATYYMFKVSSTLPDGSLQVQTFINSLRVFNLTQLSNYAFARSYTVEVSVYFAGTWQPYGLACTIVSPTPLTAIQSSQCGITILSISDPIYANVVAYAPGYRFRITKVSNPSVVYIVDKTLRDLRLNTFPVESGVTYNVEVAVKNYDGTYLPYGAACSIIAPVMYTKVMSSYCGRVISSFAEIIYADNVNGATGYRFKITNMSNLTVQYLDRPLRTFTLSLLPVIQYNTAYKIEVSVKDSNGTYLPYGAFCTIYTPLLPVPKIQLSQCEMTCSSTTELMYADDYSGATVYRFRLQNTELGYSQYVDRPTRSYSLNLFTGLQPNTAYTVKVAVKVNNVFTDFGKACDVTTPATLPTTRLAYGFDEINDSSTINDSSFLPKLYPNPFSEYFSIDAALPTTAEVSVKVYDMTGRLLEHEKISATDLPSLQLGLKYPTGVYNVSIQYNDQIKTLQVIKR